MGLTAQFTVSTIRAQRVMGLGATEANEAMSANFYMTGCRRAMLAPLGDDRVKPAIRTREDS